MHEERHGLPMAKIEKSRLGWLLWLVPVAAALLCAWYVSRDFIFSGPIITIYFQNAAGLQAQNSLLKYRGATIGEVEALQLSQAQQRVAVKAQLVSSAAGLALQGSVFWIVRPEF